MFTLTTENNFDLPTHLRPFQMWPPQWDPPKYEPPNPHFQNLLFVQIPPPMGGCVVGSVGQWVGSGQMTKYRISLDLIEIIQFCLKIYDL